LRTAEEQEAMTTNSSIVVARASPSRMEAFDALPPELRALLRECYFVVR
jgi:hypothetical protein